MASRCAIMALLLAAGLAAAPPDPGVMSTAKRAFSWARTHLLWAEEGRGAARCTWTRSTYMIGLWEYYAATVEARAADLVAQSDLAAYGSNLSYAVCAGDGGPGTWTGPCATANTSSCADNQLVGAVYIELYKAGLDRPVAHAAMPAL